MRQFLGIIVGILLASSCSEVRFSQPQPQNAKDLKVFPNEFIGSYIGTNGDTLRVQEDCFRLADDEIKNLKDERVTLRRKGDVFFLSCCEILMAGEHLDRKGWEVFPFEKKNDTLYVYFIDTSNENKAATFSRISKILPIEDVLNAKGDIEYYYVDPNIREFERMLNSQCFSVADRFVPLDR